MSSNTRLTGRDLQIGDFVEAIFQGDRDRESKTVRASVEEITKDGMMLLQPIGAPPVLVQVDSPDWSYVLIEHGKALTDEQQEEAESLFGPATGE